MYIRSMRSYGQQCAVAKALDVIGDRWTLLIIRELMIRERSRYTDIRSGLPGIATNLLGDRLRELEAAGIVHSQDAPPPVATRLFSLTERGKALEPVIAELGRWGAPLLDERHGTEEFRDHWVALPLRLYVRDRRPQDPPVRIRIQAGTESLTLETVGDGSIQVAQGDARDADASIEGAPTDVLRLLTGKTTLHEHRGRRLHYDGDPKLLRRFGTK
jgi:DNA-binding HxlR family transcriptional regulator